MNKTRANNYKLRAKITHSIPITKMLAYFAPSEDLDS